MVKMIYYCRNCNKTYSDASGIMHTCPECKSPLMQTSITADDWHQKSQEEKDAIKQSLTEQYKAQEASGALLKPATERNDKNFIGGVLSVIGWFPTVIGLIAWFVLAGEGQGVFGFIVFVACFLSGIFVLGFAEIIHLLQAILNRMP